MSKGGTNPAPGLTSARQGIIKRITYKKQAVPNLWGRFSACDALRVPGVCCTVFYSLTSAKATRRGVLRPAAPSTDKLRRPTMGRSKSDAPGVISGQRHRLPTSCAALQWAGAKATRRGALRPAAPSADALRRPTMGRGKSHLPGCAPARRAVCRQAAASYDGQGQKRPAGVRSGQTCRLPTRCASLRWAGAKATCRGDLRPAAASTDKLRRPTMGRSKSHLPG